MVSLVPNIPIYSPGDFQLIIWAADFMYVSLFLACEERWIVIIVKKQEGEWRKRVLVPDYGGIDQRITRR